MNFSPGLKIIARIFLAIYLVVGVTDGFAHCPLAISHRLTSVVKTVKVIELPGKEVATGGPFPYQNQNNGTVLCQKLAPTLTEIFHPNRLDATSRLLPPPLLSDTVAAPFLLTLKYVTGSAGMPAPPVNPRLALIRTVVMLA